MIFFLYGEDSFRSRQKLLAFKKRFLIKDSAGSGLSVFDWEESNLERQKIFDALEISNLLSSKRLVIIKNLLGKAPEDFQKAILDFLKKNEELVSDNKETIIVFWEGGVAPRGSQLFKFLEAKLPTSQKQNFAKFLGAKLNQWILKKIKEVEPRANISRSALEKLVLFCGDDMESLNNEIQKLVNFCESRMINDKDVEILVKGNLDIKIFDTIDALAEGNKRKAAHFLHSHLAQGEDPLYLLSMVVYQFRNLLKVADLKENFGVAEAEISKLAKLHPFVVRKSLMQLRNFSFEKLKRIYKKLGEIDLAVKTGRLEKNLALDKFLAEL